VLPCADETAFPYIYIYMEMQFLYFSNMIQELEYDFQGSTLEKIHRFFKLPLVGVVMKSLHLSGYFYMYSFSYY